MSDITLLHHNEQKTHEWINDFFENAHWVSRDESQALALLKATLHELRDNLPLNNLAHLSAQLPTIIRGILFEQWNPSHCFPRERKREEFLNKIKSNIPEVHRHIDIEDSVKAMFRTLYYKIDVNEIEKIKRVLPKSIREFFP